MEYDWLERRLMDSHRTIESLISRFERLSGALAEAPELGWIHAALSAYDLEYICEALRLAIGARDAIRNMRIENNELREKLGEVTHLRNCIAAKHLQLEGLVRGKRYSIVRDSVPMTVNGEDLKATDIVKGEVRLDEQIVRCRNCKHCVADPEPIDPGWPLMCDDTGRDMLDPEGFCSWGERRENDEGE